MRQLFAFILRHHFIFLFLFLELLSFGMLLNNRYQGAAVMNATENIASVIRQGTFGIRKYFSLRRINEQLVRENAELRKRLVGPLDRSQEPVATANDTLFRYLPARVISATVGKRKNYLLLDRGRRDGVKADMGVISPDGVVGTVIRVSERFSLVMPLLHVDNRTNARILRNDHLGNVEWKGGDYRKGRLKNIPVHVMLENGDTVVTSGHSLIFPPGIPIGMVEEYHTGSGRPFNEATLIFSVDFNSLHYVYVITSPVRNEFRALEALQKNDE
ncbi:MAG: rod shape-determining protein MreC [Bacteroidales bacterium]|nr:rod shape-determining protein MreC [Bacteroidales bacterium]